MSRPPPRSTLFPSTALFRSAFEYLDTEYAVQQARRLDEGALSGPLHGLPVGIKDIIDTVDMPTAWGSSIYTGHRPARDAGCVAALRRSGAVIAGKTVTTEFAYFHPGKTRNPHNLDHTPGGSSLGSAAAVARSDERRVGRACRSRWSP